MAESTAPSRRRDKPILSCTLCRGRKLRCDRQSPCNACVRRGTAADCTYSSSEQDRKDAIDYRPHARGQQARQRVARLEALVVEMRAMMQNSLQPPDDTASPSVALKEARPPCAPPDDLVNDDMGKLSITDSHAVYTGSSHWVTILEDIRHLKDELSEEQSTSTTSLELFPPDADLMRGSPVTRISVLNSATCLPREQILAMIPSRKVADRHVSFFFNTFDMGPIVLHRNKFLAEYASFWDNPSAAPIMWVGLLFSVMSMSALLQQQDAGALGLSAVDLQNMLNTYRTLAIQCLVVGDYLRPSRYTIETLILHFAVDQNVNLDASIANWILIGVVIRIAMRMGLHRDPSHWPDIRPATAEYRRRLWITLYQMDFFTSTQVGLPRIIKDSQCDTHAPLHLFDNDLNLERDEIPPQRPSTDPTPLLYIIQRHTIIKVSAEIYDVTEAGPPSPSTIVALSAKLETAVDALPSCLKYKSLDASIADSPNTILQQIILDILIHKAVYLLHRRSFMKGSIGEESAKSHELCLKAALAILDHQRRISEETQPGGLLFAIRRKVAGSLNLEFLQATMMLCFALSRFQRGHTVTADSGTPNGRKDILDALTHARSEWEKSARQSVEARRAANAITSVLQYELEKSGTPISKASNESFEQTSEIATYNYFDGLNYGQSMALDPSFFVLDDGGTEFGSMLDDFMSEQSHR